MELDFSNVKPGVLNWAIVTIMALTGIVFLKWFLNRYPVKGLTDIVNAA